MKTTSIVLAEDHLMVRQGLQLLLETEGGFRVVGQTGDGLEAIRLVEQLHPGVLVLDLNLSTLDGLEVMRQLRRRAPATKIIILSMHAGERCVADALRLGAAGYVPKECGVDDLVYAVREALAGRRYVSVPVNDCAVAIDSQEPETNATGSEELLTAREREVLHLAAEGFSNAEIASRLFISRRTVETHRANLRHKLGLRSHTDLVRFAMRQDPLGPEPDRLMERPPQTLIALPAPVAPAVAQASW